MANFIGNTSSKLFASCDYGVVHETTRMRNQDIHHLDFTDCENDSIDEVNSFQIANDFIYDTNQVERFLYSVPSYDEENSDVYDLIYNSLFVLNDDVSTSVNDTSAVLLFNVALLHHRAAIKCNNMNEFTDAFNLYSKSFEIMKSTDEVNGFSSSLIPVVAAVLHNMADIFTTFHRIEEANESLDMLENLLKISEFEDHMSDEDFEFFCRNLMLSRMTKYVIAPAA